MPAESLIPQSGTAGGDAGWLLVRPIDEERGRQATQAGAPLIPR